MQWLRDTVTRLESWQRAFAAFTVLLVVPLTGVHRVLGRGPKQVVELVLAALLLAGFALHPVVARTLRDAGPWARRLTLAFLLVILLGDAARPRTMLAYPFVSWGMFTAPVGNAQDPVQMRYTAHYSDGSSARLMPGGAVSDVVVSSLDGELKALFQRFLAGDTSLEPRLAVAVGGVARMEELRHPERPIRSVTVDRCRIPVQPPYEATCAQVRRFQVAAR
jgi:hypothetical protein